MKGAHLTALLGKSCSICRSTGTLLPVTIVPWCATAALHTIAIPAVTGQHLGDDSDLLRVIAAAGAHEELTRDGRVNCFVPAVLMFPDHSITGAMASRLTPSSGKQAITLEPLLATPIGRSAADREGTGIAHPTWRRDEGLASISRPACFAEPASCADGNLADRLLVFLSRPPPPSYRCSGDRRVLAVHDARTDSKSEC